MQCEVCEFIDSVRFYKKHQKILCDQCVDWLNGHEWVDEQGKPLENEKSQRQFELTCKKVFGG